MEYTNNVELNNVEYAKNVELNNVEYADNVELKPSQALFNTLIPISL